MSIFEENNVSIEKKISLRTKQLQLRENQWKLSGFTLANVREERGNVEAVIDGGELTRNINK